MNRLIKKEKWIEVETVTAPATTIRIANHTSCLWMWYAILLYRHNKANLITSAPEINAETPRKLRFAYLLAFCASISMHLCMIYIEIRSTDTIPRARIIRSKTKNFIHLSQVSRYLFFLFFFCLFFLLVCIQFLCLFLFRSDSFTTKGIVCKRNANLMFQNLLELNVHIAKGWHREQHHQLKNVSHRWIF